MVLNLKTPIILVFVLSVLVSGEIKAAGKKTSAKTKSDRIWVAPPKNEPEQVPVPTPGPRSEIVQPVPDSPQSNAVSSSHAQTKKRKRLDSVSFIFGSVEWLWWQEPLELVGSNGTRLAMVTTANGPCFGGGWKKIKSTSVFSLQGCFFSASNEVGLVGRGTTQYYQQGVESYGILFGPGWLWRPSSGNVTLGVQVPGFFRYADWTLPPTQGGSVTYDVASQTRVSGGLLLEGGWSVHRLNFAQKIGFLYKTGAFWVTEFDFRF
jgi:hypothetical protein